MEFLHIILLAAIQGITEWLPISSSAHLALSQQILGIRPPILFDIFLHAGTIAAVIFFMRKDLLAMLKALMKFDTGDENFTHLFFFPFPRFLEPLFLRSKMHLLPEWTMG